LINLKPKINFTLKNKNKNKINYFLKNPEFKNFKKIFQKHSILISKFNPLKIKIKNKIKRLFI